MINSVKLIKADITELAKTGRPSRYRQNTRSPLLVSAGISEDHGAPFRRRFDEAQAILVDACRAAATAPITKTHCRCAIWRDKHPIVEAVRRISAMDSVPKE